MKITKKVIESYNGKFSGDQMCSEGKRAITRFLKLHPKGQTLNIENLQAFIKNVDAFTYGVILHGILLITNNTKLARKFNKELIWRLTPKNEQMKYFLKLTNNLKKCQN